MHFPRSLLDKNRLFMIHKLDTNNDIRIYKYFIFILMGRHGEPDLS